MKKLLMIIALAIALNGQSQYKVNTKVQNKANSNVLNNSTKTGVLTATSKHKMKALSKIDKKRKKPLANNVTKEFENKIAANYKPKAGKLHRTVSAQRPYYNDAYIEYPYGKYEPYKRTIELGALLYEDLLVKFKVRQGKNYLVRLRFKIEDYTVEGTNDVSRAGLYASLGETWHSHNITMRNSKLVPADYSFDLIVRAETTGWIQIPYYHGVERGTWNSVFPWKFKSVTISEL
ncbi:MAG: hypothetical protein HKO11_08960 [Eudoraea sp.]|nr:hypothetical protein [Eudoraea sp.]NNK11275.1 hypothetical protein [Flavobacteriaceae bacterium]